MKEGIRKQGEPLGPVLPTVSPGMALFPAR